MTAADYSENRTIRLSVREFVAFVKRHGSIDQRFGGFDRAQEGAAIHRMLQRAAGPDYQKEVTLRETIAYDGYLFELWGRADGMIETDDGLTVDEIKTVTRDVMTITEDTYPDHWAQAKIYGWILTRQKKLSQITVRLTYYQVPSGTIRSMDHVYTAADLQTDVLAMIEAYLRWARAYTAWTIRRDRSIAAMSFPFKQYRKGQRQLSVAVFKCAQTKRDLLCQAPTGIGKTIGILFGAVQALGREHGERILYGTAKTTGARAAEQALEQMRQAGLRIKSVTLTAKDRVCFLEERACYPETCPYADHYFDRVTDVLFDALKQYDAFDRERITQIAKEKSLCPFELASDLSDWCDVIIGDYNYIFDPQVASERLLGIFSDADVICLLDEAHNLPDRVRGMYTAEIKKSDTAYIRKNLYQVAPSLKKQLRQLDEKLNALSTEKFQVFKAPIEEMNQLLQHMVFAFEDGEKRLTKQGKSVDDAALNWYFKLRHYLLIAGCYQENSHVTILKKTKKDVVLTQQCLDPADFVAQKTQNFRSTVYFSATLTPSHYYTQVFGAKEDTIKMALDSPFDQARFKLMVADRISTRYKDRDKTAAAVAEMITAFVKAHAGHYLIFFPSYAYMMQIADLVEATLPVLKQKQDMSIENRADFMKQFEKQPDETLVGFCVIGSYFSEGIDLTGKKLIGVGIVGVGLPKISPKNDLLKAHYQEKLGSGYDYAYKYPGFNKVLQAIGRVIRTETDRGMALLIDDRFSHRDYQALFPKYYTQITTVSDKAALSNCCQDFWQKP